MYAANNMQKQELVEFINVKHENEVIFNPPPTPPPTPNYLTEHSNNPLYWEEMGKLFKEKDKKNSELTDRLENEIKEV